MSLGSRLSRVPSFHSDEENWKHVPRLVIVLESTEDEFESGKMLPPNVKVRFRNLGLASAVRLWPKERLSLEQIRILEKSSSGFLWVENGTDVSTQTSCDSVPSPVTKRIKVEIDPRKGFYETVTQLKTTDVKKPTGSSQSRLMQMIKNVVTQLESLKSQLGGFSRFTIFNNVNQLAAALLGVAEATVIRFKQKMDVDNREKRLQTRKQRNLTALELLDDSDRKIISDHIEKCYVEESNFSIHSLHADLQNLYEYPYSPSTLYRQLKAMRYSYKLKTYNPFLTIRADIVAWRARYLRLMEELREQGAFICYYDETWCYHGMTKARGWNRTDTCAYLIANLGDLKKPRTGFTAASDKGQRAIVLAVVTEKEVLPGSVDVVVPKRAKSQILVDYHEYMSSEMFIEYMEKVLPKIKAAAPAGREPVLVIDNASIHGKLVSKIPTKDSVKADLLAFLEEYNVSTAVGATNEQLWEEAKALMETRGGRDAMKRFYIDEYAASLGVRIVRLPPYHCQFSPIELIWNQLKSHLRLAGKTTDKLEVVAERARSWLCNTDEAQIAWTYDHVLEIEQGIKLVMDDDDMRSGSRTVMLRTFDFLSPY
ncbi:hypothetical protein CAEBREN_21740 [Caenorhabditis brenneri]|uniref:Tc1-like transposase DDE domain-containing protein n=1 Tax=Caenorhabditis brenneri TaxID=135651 RepID=G0PMU9_CAEBE|nr:hypothetical protein CAEBREN_21740 [Caenorhabditis brenneri]